MGKFVKAEPVGKVKVMVGSTVHGFEFNSKP